MAEDNGNVIDITDKAAEQVPPIDRQRQWYEDVTLVIAVGLSSHALLTKKGSHVGVETLERYEQAAERLKQKAGLPSRLDT